MEQVISFFFACNLQMSTRLLMSLTMLTLEMLMNRTGDLMVEEAAETTARASFVAKSYHYLSSQTDDLQCSYYFAHFDL